MSEPRPYRRKISNYLIDRQMQRQFSLLTIVFLVVVVFVAAMLVRATIQEVLQQGLSGGAEALARMDELLLIRVSLAAFFAIAAAGLGSILWLHRVAGPAYRIRKVLSLAAQGELPEDVTLREKDFLKDMAQELNALLHHLRREQAAILEVTTTLEGLISGSPATVRGEDVRRAVERLRAASGRLPAA